METITSTTIVESFASHHLKPVWNDWGDGVTTACAYTVLVADGVDVPSDNDFRDKMAYAWDACNPTLISDDRLAQTDYDYYVANQASVTMRLTSCRVVRGHWQQMIVASLLSHGAIRNPMTWLRGRARSESNNYQRSLDRLLRRFRAAFDCPIYRITDRRGVIWLSLDPLPADIEAPYRSIIEAGI